LKESKIYCNLHPPIILFTKSGILVQYFNSKHVLIASWTETSMVILNQYEMVEL